MYSVVNKMPIFKDLFPDYQTFSSWYKSLPLSDDDNDVPNEKTFSLIAYQYNGSHCAMMEEEFKQHFSIDLYTYYKEFEATTENILDLMKLTDEDIAIANSMITNNADIPETEASTDETSVDFISTQQKVINKKGKLQIQRELLSNKRALTTRTFLKRFKHLFEICVDDAYTFVVEEPEGD